MKYLQMHRFPPPPMLPPPPGIPPSLSSGLGSNSWMNDDDYPRFDQQPPPKIVQQTQNPIPNTPNSPVEDPAKKKLPPPPLMSLKIDKPANQAEKNELVLPKALEDVLALSSQLKETSNQQQQSLAAQNVDFLNDFDADGSDEDDNNTQTVVKGNKSKDKNRKKKKRKKENRQKKLEEARKKEEQIENQENQNETSESPEKSKSKSSTKENVEIEYVPEKVTVADLAPMYRQFYRVFEIFKLENKPKEAPMPVQTAEDIKAKKATEKIGSDEEMDDDDEDADDKIDDKDRISKRKLKKMTRLSVAELKQIVHRPDVVEMHDVTARDPKLLIQLKAHRNTVQVPRHWCFKRKYLQGKRGIEKPPFDLPAFIKKTGIMEMRASLQEKDEAKSMKAKMREKIRPKMGKIDIDYQKLHDAFFKWQVKPRMTIHGDLYYEGKEFETRLKEKKPGDLSEELRTALGMPIGPACHKIPPPWLIAQQRYGPPPSYPNLKIPGLNAPIPEGCCFGYHAGGWGKPPVDENGKPLYGDVFGTSNLDNDSGLGEEEIDRTLWGELEEESEEESEESDDEEGEEDLTVPQIDATGLQTPGLETPSGLTSVQGMETPDSIELRKKKIEAEMEDNETPVLYHVIPEKRNEKIAGSMMASTHVYDISGSAAMAQAANRRAAGHVEREGMVELALNPDELEMDNEAMAQRYEQQMREQQSHLQKEDLSDMLAEHVARQKSKRKRQQTTTTTQKQKDDYKKFKF
ncbi:hypothetical protein ACKWTF_009341 [Chironomus riparius]